FAETGIRDLFMLLHATIRKHASQPATVRLRNRWVTVDPRDWKTRNDMTVNVGLGTGSKAEQLANLQLLIGAQEKAIPAGMVSARNLHESAKELTKLLGHKDTDRFFTAPGQPANPADPASAPIPPPPDPRQAEIAAKAKAEQDKISADAAHQKMRMQMELTLEQQPCEREKQLKLLDAELKREEHRRRMTVDAVIAATAPAAHESIGPDGHDLADPRSQSGAGGNTPPRSAVGASTSHAAGSAALVAGLMDTLQRMSAP